MNAGYETDRKLLMQVPVSLDGHVSSCEQEKLIHQAKEILARFHSPIEITCVYDRYMGISPGACRKITEETTFYPVPEYDDYFSDFAIRLLFRDCNYTDYIFLGTHPCIKEIMRCIGRKAKQIVLMDRRNRMGEAKEYGEYLMDNYGIAAEILPLDGSALNYIRSSRRMCIVDSAPQIPVDIRNLHGGSLWIDLTSCRARESRIRDMAYKSGGNVRYLSLIRYFREVKRDLPRTPSFVLPMAFQERPYYLNRR